MPLPVAASWFRAETLGPGLAMLYEPHVHVLLRANMFLIGGRDRDLILDTGMGVAPLRPVLDGMRDPAKPILCVSTHAHVDHVGGAHEFEERLIHAAEAEAQAAPRSGGLLAADYAPEAQARYEAAGYPPLTPVLIDALPHAGYAPAAYERRPAPPTGLLGEGEAVDLGGRRFEVLHLPGHSPGGIGLFERATGTLFAGDAIYDGPLIYEGPGADLDAYERTFRKLEALPVTVVHAGHEPSFGRARMMEIVARYRRLWAAG